MSADRFQRAMVVMNLNPNERAWFPRWVEGYVGFHGLREVWQSEAGNVPLDRDRVIAYLRSLRDKGVPAWRRLQATRALEIYQATVLRHTTVDFQPIREKLREIDARERRAGGTSAAASAGAFDGEGNAGLLDETEPQSVQRMRARMRVLHHPISTENAYVGWVSRFIKHLGDERLERYGEPEIADFLTDLAVTRTVTAGTQNQALCGLLFFYEKVLGRDINFVNSVRAKSSEYRPVVLTKNEIAELFPSFIGV